MKKIIYVLLWYPTGLLLGFFVASIWQLIIEIFFPTVDRLTYAVVVYPVFCTLGIIFGAVCGPIAWRKIYIEGIRGKKYITK